MVTKLTIRLVGSTSLIVQYLHGNGCYAMQGGYQTIWMHILSKNTCTCTHAKYYFNISKWYYLIFEVFYHLTLVVPS